MLHLGHWYAQSHPTEDFAETFSVWMQPKARWRRDYADWPAIHKLEFADQIIRKIAMQTPKHRDRSVIDPLSGVDQTLGDHYRLRKERYGGTEHRYDRWMARVFAPRTHRPYAIAASR
ncbi:MAG: hypothetical protein HQ492_07200, partial [Woeseiaceae bacterium]|nr:hypothetical protein [Woeseiaceae bacterium]